MGLTRGTIAFAFITTITPGAFADNVATAPAGTIYEVPAKARFSQMGRATYYHKSLHGLRTASGERFNAQAMTAAHRRLKLGTYVRVINLRNRRSIVVRINDRLPPRSRAIIDLSPKAARQLGMFDHGVARVKITGISPEEFKAENRPR